MNVDEALKASTVRGLTTGDIEALVSACPEPRRQALDRLATELASKFMTGHAKFREADDLARVMFTYAAWNDVLGDALHKVHLAFNAGERLPANAPSALGSFAYTRVQLARILTSLVAT